MTIMLPEHKEGSHDCGSVVVGWGGLEKKEDIVWWKYMWQPSLVLWWVSLSLESHQLWLWTQLGNSWGQNGCCKPRQSYSHHVVLLQGRKSANSVRKKNILHLLDIKIFAPWKSCIGFTTFTFACDINLICWAKAYDSIHRLNYWHICIQKGWVYDLK